MAWIVVTEVYQDVEDVRSVADRARCQGQSVGLIPTMGALHEGHRGLMREAVRENDVNVVSVFVNPTQFDSEEDAEAYPRSMDEDRRVVEEEGVDHLFAPDVDTMYPPGDATYLRVDNTLTARYEAEFRPGFFQGVTRVVSKLLNIVPADRVYFGAKDLQQNLVVRRMVTDLHFPHTVRSVPVVRDQHGVAYSSRNRRLSDEGWSIARSMAHTMEEVRSEASDLSRDDLDAYRRRFEEIGVDLDYLDVVSYPTYEPVSPADPSAVLLVAGHVGEVRLKDNRPLHVDSIQELEQASRTSV